MYHAPQSIKIVTYGPEDAQRDLDGMAPNRPPSNADIAKYCDDMLNGAWEETTWIPLLKDTCGRLIDGQNRMCALVKAGKVKPEIRITFIVITGCGDDAFHKIDIGRKRTASDLIRILKPEARNVAGVAAIAAAMMRRLEKGPRYNAGRRINVAQHAVTYYDIISAYAVRFRRGDFPAYGAGIIGCFCNAAIQYGRPVVDPWVEKFSTQNWSNWSNGLDPFKALFKVVVGYKLRGLHLEEEAHYALTVTAIKYTLAGKPLKVCRPSTSDLPRSVKAIEALTSE